MSFQIFLGLANAATNNSILTSGTATVILNPEHAEVLQSLKDKIKDFPVKTRDPWQIMWANESQVQGTGDNL